MYYLNYYYKFVCLTNFFTFKTVNIKNAYNLTH